MRPAGLPSSLRRRRISWPGNACNVCNVASRGQVGLTTRPSRTAFARWVRASSAHTATEGALGIGSAADHQQLEDQAEAAAMLHRVLGRSDGDGGPGVGEEGSIDEAEIEQDLHTLHTLHTDLPTLHALHTLHTLYIFVTYVTYVTFVTCVACDRAGDGDARPLFSDCGRGGRHAPAGTWAPIRGHSLPRGDVRRECTQAQCSHHIYSVLLLPPHASPLLATCR